MTHTLVALIGQTAMKWAVMTNRYAEKAYDIRHESFCRGGTDGEKYNALIAEALTAAYIEGLERAAEIALYGDCDYGCNQFIADAITKEAEQEGK